MQKTSCAKQQFKSNAYSDFVLKNVYQLWLRQELTDLKFLINEKTFHVHRLVLQTCSPYFNALLSLNLKETTEKCIELANVSSNVFELLLNYIYTGAISVDETNVCELIIAADYFGFCELSEYYCQYLCDRLSDYNAIDVFEFFKVYSFDSYESWTRQHLCRNFSKHLADDVFLHVDFKLLYTLLTSGDLYVNSEFEIFDCIIQWLSFDYGQRRVFTKQLLCVLKLSSIKSVKLFNYINGIHCDELKITIGNYLYEKFNEFDDRYCSGRIEEARKYLRKSVLVIGGVRDTQTNALNKRVFCFDTVHLQLFALPSLLTQRSNHCVCEFNDLVFVAGGEVNLCISDLVEVYDLDYFRNLIKEHRTGVDDNDSDDDDGVHDNDGSGLNFKCEMVQSRTDFGMCTLDDRLYVFGGWIGSDVGDSIEFYTPIENKWVRMASSLPTLRYEFACVALTNSSFIYLIGGTSVFEQKLALVERFDVSNQTWQTCAPMHEKRSGCCVSVVDERIYAIGGFNGRSVLGSVEVYDPLNDRWKLVESMNHSRYGCVASTIDGLIYVLGGVSSTSTKELVLTVEYYDPRLDEWHEIDDKRLNLGVFKASTVNV